MSIKQKIARRAVKTTARHTAHGTASKLKRTPVRSASLIGLGVIFGLWAGWLLTRSGSDPEPAAQ